MGWTFTHRGETPIKEFLTGRINCENSHGKWTVLDIAIVKMRTAYMAVEIFRRNEKGDLDQATRRVVAFVFLLSYQRNDYHDTGYKDMDETVGPYESECPERILKMLTPTTNEQALAWRQRCWTRLSERKKVRLQRGMVVKTKPIRFADGRERSKFKVLNTRPLRLGCLDTHAICRVSRSTLVHSMLGPAMSS
ncbi:DUF6927 domain-containing protein [Desulfurivibrio sp. D14AmB]|uniref:DUF6927 domain-containing protein n=1 Tax=Desulfurivibrio sp. D14AmB TaxID=3374370 RepID=UPI00376F09F1